MTQEDIERMAREVVEGHFYLMADGEYEARRAARPDWQRGEAVVAAALRKAFNAGVTAADDAVNGPIATAHERVRALKLPE